MTNALVVPTRWGSPESTDRAMTLIAQEAVAQLNSADGDILRAKTALATFFQRWRQWTAQDSDRGISDAMNIAFNEFFSQLVYHISPAMDPDDTLMEIEEGFLNISGETMEDHEGHLAAQESISPTVAKEWLSVFCTVLRQSANGLQEEQVLPLPGLGQFSPGLYRALPRLNSQTGKWEASPNFRAVRFKSYKALKEVAAKMPPTSNWEDVFPFFKSALPQVSKQELERQINGIARVLFAALTGPKAACELAGIGKFRRHIPESVQGLNPKTGEKIVIPGNRAVVYFWRDRTFRLKSPSER